jgi:hypothetical protein
VGLAKSWLGEAAEIATELCGLTKIAFDSRGATLELNSDTAHLSRGGLPRSG